MSAELGRAVRDLAAATLHLHTAMAERLGVAPTDLAALHHLAAGPLSHRELGGRLGLRPASTTTVVDRLVGRGHAERRRSPSDARSVLVASTEEGRATARGALAGATEALAAAQARRGDAETAAILGFLTEAAGILHAAAGAPRDTPIAVSREISGPG